MLSFNKFDVANKLKQQTNTVTPINEPDVYANINAHHNVPKNTVFPKNKFEFPSKPKHLSCDFTNTNMNKPLQQPNRFTTNIPFKQQNNSFNNPLNQFINYQLNSNVKLGSQFVGDNYPCFVIAEAGLNHNADINLAKLLIDQAISCKCNAIKFQTYLDNSRISPKVKSVNYVEKADGLRESTNEIFNRLSLNKIFHKKIFDYARKKKIEIFSTPFDEKSVDYLEELNVNFYKIASVDIVNLPLIRKVGLTGKPLILSTGMSDFSTVEDAVKVFKETKNKNLILLHCLSSYPANKLEMNLRVIKTFKDLYISRRVICSNLSKPILTSYS
jgi:hypothetical protein